jgi:hypothetical protein
VTDLARIREIVAASFDPKPFMPADAAKWNQAYERYLKLA